MRRALWETLVDVMQAVQPQALGPVGLRVTGLSLDLPVEVVLRTGRDGEVEMLADLPRWRWVTVFDEPRSRLQLECREEAEGGRS